VIAFVPSLERPPHPQYGLFFKNLIPLLAINSLLSKKNAREIPGPVIRPPAASPLKVSQAFGLWLNCHFITGLGNNLLVILIPWYQVLKAITSLFLLKLEKILCM
jgi:hypothetical protein